MEYVIFELGPGCLEDNTMIKLVEVNNPSYIKSLLDLELLQSSICHLHCLPNGLHFLKPAQLQININGERGFSEIALEKIVALYGSYSNDKQKMEWQQVEDIDLNESRILLNISKFSWYSFIEASLSLIPRILCHLNHFFQAYAYVLHRRSSETGTLDIKVVFVSSFVREKLGDSPMINLAKDWEDFHGNNNNEDIIDINTDRNHEIQLNFQGKELDSYTFEIDISKLDNGGFVVHHFKRIQVNFPAKGQLEVKESGNKNSKWKLNVDEENSQGAVINKEITSGDDVNAKDVGTSPGVENTKQELTSGDDAKAKDVGNSPGVENTKQEEWKYVDESTKHRQLLLKLIEYGRNPSVEVNVEGNVRVIFSEEFCIGEGSDATRVYLGLEEDTGTEYVYLILDLCEESLESFVKSSTLHDLQKALPDILRQILKGLADLHSGPNPILHRDLKPSNVLRDSKSKFLIADFGISRIMKNDSTTYKSNTSMGTVHWIAPESYCEDDDTVNKARYKRRSDVYVSVGM
ncbi:U-box domain-containing protein 52-like [Xenia sp. Carnegie-2017]|uniref:U-box domain-containing protein 52-like n=1 Tax=Xenia sp. Carnegie-2017 TaxID=2897299 RepID=UPI001F0461E5|nr:U-box domain-containing protein 52-like [Xenia sp. Carnegie-2017]